MYQAEHCTCRQIESGRSPSNACSRIFVVSRHLIAAELKTTSALAIIHGSTGHESGLGLPGFCQCSVEIPTARIGPSSLSVAQEIKPESLLLRCRHAGSFPAIKKREPNFTGAA